MPDPTIPEITDEEAAVLRLHSIPFSHYYAMLHADNRGLLDIRSGSLTDLGRAALAKHIADREREIRRKAIAKCRYAVDAFMEMEDDISGDIHARLLEHIYNLEVQQ